MSKVFCPEIKDRCRDDCRNWDTEKSGCLTVIRVDQAMKLAESQKENAAKQSAYLESAQSLVTMEVAILNSLFGEILSDDSVSSSIKDWISEYTK